MAKNVTVQVDDELATKMEKLLDVNWSQVVRTCLKRYCDICLNPNIEALVQKIKKQKEEAYSEGYKAALEWFKQEDIRYEDINKAFQDLAKLESDFNSWVKEEYGSWRHAREDGARPDEDLEREENRFWNSIVEICIKELPNSYDISDAFVKGFKAALEKLEKAS